MLIKSSAKNTSLTIEHDGELILRIEADNIDVACDVVKLVMNSAEVNQQINSFITNLFNS